MAKINPWGNIDWLIPKIGKRNWKAVMCASFEPRCTALAEWLGKNSYDNTHVCLRISDPINRFTFDVEKATSHHEGRIVSSLKNKVEIISSDLLVSPSYWNNFSNNVADGQDISLLLDISSIPKRAFLFMVKKFMASSNVRDLVVCYTKPEGYKEGALTEDADPPTALPGFSRISSNDGESTVVVSVGYMAFNLEDLLEVHKGRAPRFLFPFPPGSPSFRRSWRLLHELSPELNKQAEIKRIHSLDMFAVLDWLRDINREESGNINLIPLGPKPHALAMGLAFKEIGDRAEIVYSQPKLYHPDYSHGVLKNALGDPDITAYCLRRDYKNTI